MAGLDQDGALPQLQAGGSRQYGGPVPAGMHAQLTGAGRPRRRRDGPQLEQTGFAIVARRTFTIELTPPHPAGRYARAYLRPTRPVLEGRIATEDLAILDTLIDSDGPDSLPHRNDLTVRGARTAWIARRP